MRSEKAVCISIPARDCPFMADTCQNIFWVLIYHRQMPSRYRISRYSNQLG